MDEVYVERGVEIATGRAEGRKAAELDSCFAYLRGQQLNFRNVNP